MLMNSSCYKMKEIPNKYKKHMSLVFFGLKTQHELDEDLARYDVDAIEQLKSDVLTSMQKDRVETTYVISFIPKNKHLKLPNKIIKKPEDLEGLEEFLQAHPETYEVWRFKKEADGIIGRFVIKENEEQILEQVWSSDHRDIERYNAGSGIPMLRASRNRWYSRYTIDAVESIPEDKKEVAQRVFIQAVTEIERNREKIEMMLEECKKNGVSELALEYRIDSRGFSFIDWDTPNDIKVLGSLFPNMQDEREGR